MADKRAPTRRRRESATPSRTASAGADATRIAAFVPRGPECAFANVRMLGRIVGAFYDEMLRPSDLRAAQVALLWAIAATEPVDQKALGRITETDQTTLSRTVENLRASGLVAVGSSGSQVSHDALGGCGIIQRVPPGAAIVSVIGCVGCSHDMVIASACEDRVLTGSV